MEATVDYAQYDETTLKEAVRSEMKRLGISQTKLAKESGISQARLSQWFAGKYRGKSDVVEQDVARWLHSSQVRTKDAAKLTAAPEWKKTPTAEKILAALRYAKHAGDIALIYGGAGVGKTCTAKNFQDMNPNTWIATMSPAMNTIPAALERISLAVGLPEVQPSAIKMENAIVDRLTDSNGLLIIDEAQHLSVSGLDAIRSIHDATGTGVALMGNESVYARITGGSRQAHFAQLFSRVGYRVQLGSPSLGDVEAIVAAWGVEDSTAQALCMDIARQAGALRGLTKVLRLAHMSLGEEDRNLTTDHIQTALTLLGGMAA